MLTVKLLLNFLSVKEKVDSSMCPDIAGRDFWHTAVLIVLLVFPR